MKFKAFFFHCLGFKKRNLIFYGILLLLLQFQIAKANNRELHFHQAEIVKPSPSIPYYHFKVKIDNENKNAFEIKKIVANGNEVHHFEIREQSWSKSNDKAFPFSWPVFAEDKDFVFKNPCLVGRLNWENGKKYNLEITYSIKDSKDEKRIKQEIIAPKKGGYWNTNWKYYKSIVVSEDYGKDRKNEPVQFSLAFYTDQVTELSRELRIVQVDEDGNTKVLPSQVYDVQKYMKKDKPRYDKNGALRPYYWVPTVYAKVVVPISIEAKSDVVLLAFYDNPKAEKPEVTSNLKVTGKGLELNIENEYYKVKLHPNSGMLNEITLKSNPKFTLEHKLETNGAIHWNPGAYSPKRPWMHASDWDTPENVDSVSGPLMFTFHRKGHMPNMPEIGLAITYKFFNNLPYILMSTTLEVKKSIPLQAFRNAEIVFNHKLINKAAWQDPTSEEPRIIDLKEIPNLTEIHMPLDISWVSFLNSKERVGFAGIPLEYTNSTMNDEPFEYNPYMYITKGPWVYWTRVLVTPYMTQNMQQIIEVPAGNFYWEKWAWLPYKLESDGKFEELNDLQEQLKHPLRIQVSGERDARVRIPDEIYTDSTKTGWEEINK